MNHQQLYTNGFNVYVTKDVPCSHCAAVLSSHAIERRDDQGSWRIVCQSCHRDIVTVEPAE